MPHTHTNKPLSSTMMRLSEQRRLHPLSFYVIGAVAIGTLAYNVLNSNDTFEHGTNNKDTIVRRLGFQNSELKSYRFFDVSNATAEALLDGSLDLDTDGFPWATEHLLPISEDPDPSKETSIFWHIPKSGGTTAKSVAHCNDKATHVASDVFSWEGAWEDGAITSDKWAGDVVFSSMPSHAVMGLFQGTHRKGRMLAMFRHPIDRLISKFYYIQVATWENSYRPDLRGMDIVDWATDVNVDDNHLVNRLAGNLNRKMADEGQLQLAMATVRKYFIVGLMSEMDESIRRFNKVMGIDGSDLGCALGHSNSNSHPKVSCSLSLILVLNDL